MSLVLIRDMLDEEELFQLKEEFILFQFEMPDSGDDGFSDALWARAEVLYSSKIDEEELHKAERLTWIHVPSPFLDGLPMPAIRKHTDLFVTQTLEEHTEEAARFSLAALLAYAKNLFAWRESTAAGKSIKSYRLAESARALANLTLVQIGLGPIGSQIVRYAHELGMRVIGIREQASFHPYCNQVLSLSELPSALSQANIVVMTAGREEGGFEVRLGSTELNAMPADSSLIVIGTDANLDIAAFSPDACAKLRGLALDLHFANPKNVTALLGLPNLILSPAVAAYPPDDERHAFRLFRHNLRQFAHENYRDMKNLVQRSSVSEV